MFMIDKLTTPEIARVFGQIQRTGTGCWEWVGYRIPQGYGRIRFRGGEVLLHRLLYAWAVGPLPPRVSKLNLDHLCRNRSCCNPVHLELVTMQENIRRGMAGATKGWYPLKAHVHAKKTHCPQGHPYSGDNLYVLSQDKQKNHRMCKTCRSEHQRKRKQSLKT